MRWGVVEGRNEGVGSGMSSAGVGLVRVVYFCWILV